MLDGLIVARVAVRIAHVRCRYLDTGSTEVRHVHDFSREYVWEDCSLKCQGYNLLHRLKAPSAPNPADMEGRQGAASL